MDYKNLRAKDGQIKLNQSVYQDPNYKRHDEVGWNYRLSEISAAVAMAQLEDLENKVNKRMEVAQIFLDAIEECEYLVPQRCPEGVENSYFTLALLYEGEETIGVTWQQFREKYVELGGDGFYGAWSVPYLEPVMVEKKYVKRYPEIYQKLEYPKGLCPVAEMIQPKIMQLKTNYRDLELAKQKAESLRKTIEFYKDKR